MSKCRYCFGGYCNNEDVRAIELRTRPGGMAVKAQQEQNAANIYAATSDTSTSQSG